MDRVMPIGGYFDREKWGYTAGYSITWAMIEPHEKQAQLNHCGQSLEKLAKRGGLSACEAIAILEDRPWSKIDNDKAIQKLKEMISVWIKN